MAVTEEQGRHIEQTFKSMHGRLHAYAVTALKNEFQAEEAIQETFCIVCEKPQDMLSSPNPPGWVVNVLKNVLGNIRKRNFTLEKYFIAAEDASVEWMQDSCHKVDDNIDLIYADLIREKDFYLLKQVILEKRTLLDMAEELGISVEACKKRFQRAEKKFRQEIEKIDQIGVP